MNMHRRTLRFLAGQAAGGGSVGLVVLLLLLLSDAAGLASLLDTAGDRAVATLMLMAAFAGTFATAAFATALDDLPAE
jgi:hypothetical protein